MVGKDQTPASKEFHENMTPEFDHIFYRSFVCVQSDENRLLPTPGLLQGVLPEYPGILMVQSGKCFLRKRHAVRMMHPPGSQREGVVPLQNWISDHGSDLTFHKQDVGVRVWARGP